MKKSQIFILIFMVSLLPVIVSCNSEAAKITATLSDFSGKVLVTEGKTNLSVTKGMKLGVNSILTTEAGAKAKLLFDDGAKILIEEKSVLVMKELAKPSKDSTLDIVVELVKGLIYFDVTKRKSSKFQMDSSVAVSGVKGTKGTFAAGGKDDSVNRWVLVEGKLEIYTKEKPEDKIFITNEEEAKLDSSGKLSKGKTSLVKEKFFGVPILTDPDVNISVITGGN